MAVMAQRYGRRRRRAAREAFAELEGHARRLQLETFTLHKQLRSEQIRGLELERRLKVGTIGELNQWLIDSKRVDDFARKLRDALVEACRPGLQEAALQVLDAIALEARRSGRRPIDLRFVGRGMPWESLLEVEAKFDAFYRIRVNG
jgi:hypothetical protein